MRGRAAINEALRVLALKGTMDLKTRYVHESGDLALLSGEWTLTGTGPDGARSTCATAAQKSSGDGPTAPGSMLDHPFGAGAE